MPRTPESSCVISFRYVNETIDTESQLVVTYNNHDKSADTYIYSDVPLYIYQALVNAPSKGKALNALVKGVYDFEKV